MKTRQARPDDDVPPRAIAWDIAILMLVLLVGAIALLIGQGATVPEPEAGPPSREAVVVPLGAAPAAAVARR